MCSVIMAVVCSIVLMIMKVKYALILGLFIGAMDMIPYFGSIISFVISLIVTFITGGVWKGVWTGVVLLVLQQIDGNLLGPKIMGNSLEIRPLWIIFAVTVGGALFGFMGMLFSVPVLAIIRAIMSDYFTAREMKKKCQRKVKIMSKKIAVIGGGRPDFLRRYLRHRTETAVTIYESGERVGRKILATGNGRCNMTNMNADIEKLSRQKS